MDIGFYFYLKLVRYMDRYSELNLSISLHDHIHPISLFVKVININLSM